MRLCFYNPQATLGKTLSSFLLGNVGVKRFSYLLDFIRDSRYSTAIIVDGTASSLTGSSLLVKFISNNYILIRLISFFEAYIWCWLNHFNPFKIKIIFNKKDLYVNNDVIFGFAFFTDTFINEKMVEKSILKDFKGTKVFHVSHFFSRTKLISSSLKRLGVTLGIAEANVSSSGYFKKYFDFIDSVYVLPFVVADRFKFLKNFKKRKSKCFATGAELVLCSDINSCHPDFKEYVDYFKTEVLHPMRKEIYVHQEDLKDIIDCYISPHSREYSKNKIIRILGKVFKNERKTNKYYSFNIVDKYNEYKMFVAPEENIGLPSVNFIEGMTCGCVYIGLRHPMYDELGLVSGVNYIGYNGSLKDLREKIEYYSSNDSELERISESGMALVKERFLENTTKDNLWGYLEDLIQKRNLR